MAKMCKFIGLLWLVIGLLVILYYSINYGGSFGEGSLLGEMPSWSAVSSVIDLTVLPLFRIFVYVIPAFALFYGVGYFVEKTEEGK